MSTMNLKSENTSLLRKSGSVPMYLSREYRYTQMHFLFHEKLKVVEVYPIRFEMTHCKNLYLDL